MRKAAREDLWGAVTATLPVLVVIVSLLPVILAAAGKLGLDPPQTTSWIIAICGIPGVITLFLALRYRQPLLLTGNLGAIVLVASLSSSISYGEMAAGTMLAGVAYAVLTLFGLPRRLGAIVPAPIVAGILAGISLPFVVGLFDALGRAPFVVAATVVAYGIGRIVLGPGGTAVLPAIVVGIGAAALHGDVAPLRLQTAFPQPTLMTPHVTLAGTLAVMPVVVVFLALANVPSSVYLRDRGYQPPERILGLGTGAGTVLASFLGPTGICVPFMFVPFVSGEAAGPREKRYRAAVVVSIYLLALAALAGATVAIVTLFPAALLQGLAGLALLGVLVGSVRDVASSRLRLSPVVAFAVATSRLSLLGLGPLFWAVTLGTLSAYLLERPLLAVEVDVD